MLQPLGISAEAEAVYVALGPLPSGVGDRVGAADRVNTGVRSRDPRGVAKLGLATDSSLGHWRALPLLDVVNQLKAQRLSEIELASVAAESLESHLLAAGTSQDDVKTLVGREAIVAAHRELLNSARREICVLRQTSICASPARRHRGGVERRAGMASPGPPRHLACGLPPRLRP